MTRWSPRATRRLSPMCLSIAPRRSMSWARGRRARRKRAVGGSPRQSAPNSRRLAEILKGAMPRAAAVLYLAGRDRKPAIEAALANIEAFELAEVYAAEPRQSWRPQEIRALEACGFALHYSRRSAALAAGARQRGGRGRAFPRHDAHLPVGRCRRAAARVGRRARPRRGATRRTGLACDFEASRSGIFIATPLPYIGRAQAEGRTSNG